MRDMMIWWFLVLDFWYNPRWIWKSQAEKRTVRNRRTGESLPQRSGICGNRWRLTLWALIPSGNQTWQWEIHYKWKFEWEKDTYKLAILHRHVSLVRERPNTFHGRYLYDEHTGHPQDMLVPWCSMNSTSEIIWEFCLQVSVAETRLCSTSISGIPPQGQGVLQAWIKRQRWMINPADSHGSHPKTEP
jgi:hypothetical protein